MYGHVNCRVMPPAVAAQLERLREREEVRFGTAAGVLVDEPEVRPLLPPPPPPPPPPLLLPLPLPLLLLLLLLLKQSMSTWRDHGWPASRVQV